MSPFFLEGLYFLKFISQIKLLVFICLEKQQILKFWIAHEF